MPRKVFEYSAHKERKAPKWQRTKGFLERKSDWSKRAKTYRVKQTIKKSLERHAAQRNPDEFDYSMVNAQVNEDGLRVNKRAPVKGPQQKALNAKALPLLRLRATEEMKAVAKLQQEAAFAFKAKGTKTVFEDEGEEGGGEVVVHDVSRKRKVNDSEGGDVHTPNKSAKRSKREDFALPIPDSKSKAAKALKLHMEKMAHAKKLVKHVELQQKLLTKGKRRTVKDANGKKITKWLPIRKK